MFTAQFTELLEEPFLVLPGTIPMEWGKNPLKCEWEDGLLRAFLLAAGNQVAL